LKLLLDADHAFGGFREGPANGSVRHTPASCKPGPGDFGPIWTAINTLGRVAVSLPPHLSR
jgi:hypothetical protein